VKVGNAWNVTFSAESRKLPLEIEFLLKFCILYIIDDTIPHPHCLLFPVIWGMMDVPSIEPGCYDFLGIIFTPTTSKLERVGHLEETFVQSDKCGE